MTQQDLTITFLEDGAQPPESVADALVSYVASAQKTLDIAIYDCALTGDVASTVGSALQAAAGRGVAVRIGYFTGPHQSPLVPPPQPGTSASFLAPLGLQTEGITGFQVLMHHKYVVRDAGTPNASVWTGSTNWTNDSWSREENVIVVVTSPDLADRYTADFNELWQEGNVDHSGGSDGGSFTSTYNGSPLSGQVWFSPGGGQVMAHAVGDAIGAAQQRILVSSPVITDGPILGALKDVVAAGRLTVSGVYDGTQMQEAIRQWGGPHGSTWKPAAFEQVVSQGTWGAKQSTPYTPSSVHDYMHAKIVVVDDLVFTGSYNFSSSGESNAENLLRLQNGALADTCAAYINRLIARYGSRQ